MFQILSAYPELTDNIGLVGVLLYLASFYLIQSGRICGNGLVYAAANVLAAAFVLISLANAFNMASFLIQVSFISIGICGIVRKLYMRPLKDIPSLATEYTIHRPEL